MWAIQVLSLLCLLAAGVSSAAVGDVCANNDACSNTNTNSYCYQEYSSGDTCITAKECRCKRGYTGPTCTVAPKYLGDTCAAAADCVAVKDAVCPESKCACPADQTKVSKYNCILTATAKRIGEACTTGTHICYYETERTLITSAQCTGSVCVCPAKTKKYGTTCKPVSIDEECSADVDCPYKSTCAGTPKVCTCASTFSPTTDKTGCVLTSAALTENAVCVIADHKCDHNDQLACEACTPAVDTTTKCALKTGLLGATCSIASDCSSKVAVCNTNCECDTGYKAYGSTTCVPTGLYKSACWTKDDCTVTGNVCSENECVCDEKRVEKGDGTGCDCKPDRNATTDGCICNADKPVDLGGECVTGTMDSTCIEPSHCAHLEHSQCKESKCACAEGFEKSEATCKCPTNSKLVGDKCEKESGAGIKSAWLPLTVVAGLLSILSRSYI